MRASRGEEFDDVMAVGGRGPALAPGAVGLRAPGPRPLRRADGRRAGLPGRHRADARDRVKDEFVSSVSHELRTPLTSALAYLELLDESTDVSARGPPAGRPPRAATCCGSRTWSPTCSSPRRASAGSPLVDPYRVDLAVILCEALDAAALDADSRGRAHHESGCPAPCRPSPTGCGCARSSTTCSPTRSPTRREGCLVDGRPWRRASEHVVLTITDEGTGIEPDRRGAGVRPLPPRRERPPAPGARHRPRPHDRAQHRRGPRRRGLAGEHARRGHQRLRAAAPLSGPPGPAQAGGSGGRRAPRGLAHSRSWRVLAPAERGLVAGDVDQDAARSAGRTRVVVVEVDAEVAHAAVCCARRSARCAPPAW